VKALVKTTFLMSMNDGRRVEAPCWCVPDTYGELVVNRQSPPGKGWNVSHADVGAAVLRGAPSRAAALAAALDVRRAMKRIRAKHGLR
jgi:hypothetical protein